MIHLKKIEFIDSLSLHKKEDSNAAHSQILKNFSQRATETLRSTVLGSHTLSCLLYNTSILACF